MRLVKVSAKVESGWQEALDNFLLVKKAEGAAPRTLQDYRAWTTRFVKAHPDCWRDYETLKQAVIYHFGDLADKAPATFNLSRQYLKVFFGWCVGEGILPANPVTVKKRKDAGQPRSVEMDSVKQLLGTCNLRSYSGLRDYTAILLTVDTGIRPSEMLALKPEDIALRGMEAHITAATAKTREGRTVVFSNQTAKALIKLLQSRPADWPQTAPVFSSENGTMMLETSWAHKLNIYSNKLGIKVTPYTLWHTFALTALRNGMDAFAVQRMMGHADLQMTRRYVAMTGEDLHRQHSQASPVQALFPRGKRVRKV